MFVSIDSYPLTDGTVSGGFAISAMRVSVERIFDIAIPIGAINPQVYDRDIHKTVVDFEVTRLHASFTAADLYVADHDAAIPSSGTVLFFPTSGPVSPSSNARFLLHAALISHRLVRLNGKATTHAYHIEGGMFNGSPAYYIITEDEFFILTEAGFKFETEH